MNTINRYTTIALAVMGCVTFANCDDTGLPHYETKVTTTVITESQEPLINCKVTVIHDPLDLSNQPSKKAFTNALGQAITSARSRRSLKIKTQKDGYYPTCEERIKNVPVPDDYSNKTLKELSYQVIARKIINPIPLHAKSNDLPIPGTDQWIGFDLQKSDWIAPYGKGTESDIEFLLHNQSTRLGMHGNESISDAIEKIVQLHEQHPRHKTAFMEQRDRFFMLPVGTSTYDQAIDFKMHLWSGKLKMRVPHDKGGMIAEKERYLIYSRSPQSDYVGHRVAEMRMPHHAPVEGYLREHQWEKKPNFTPPPDEKLGFFIKTRIKTDESGNIISAHYAKIIQDLEIDIRGRIKFTSYFNPTPNDTNLEFDPNKNLTPHLKDLEKPYLP